MAESNAVMAGKVHVAGLADLLSRLFEADELRRFLFDASLDAELPGPGASMASLAFEAARALERHGRIDSELFRRLRVARPGRTEDIDRVAGEAVRPDGLFSVPHRPVVGFCGRDALASTVRATLATEGRVVLAGAPGVGKTQLSLAVAGAERGRPLVAWLPAGDTEEFFAALSGLAVRLGWRAAPPRPSGYPALLEQFAGLEGALLVVDGANDPVVMAPLVAQLRACAVMVTSTSATGWGRGMVVQRVAGLEVDAACGYLLKAVGSEDRDAATALAIAVEGLPLALAQMAAYCIETGRTLSSYVDLLNSEGVTLIDHPGGAPEYPAALSTVVRLALERLEGRDADALAVVRTIAHLGPNAFPRAVLEAHHEGHAPSAAGPFQGRRLDLAIAAAQRLGFLEVEPGYLRMHGLFQELVTHLAGPTTAEVYRAVALRNAGEALRSAVKDLERLRPVPADAASWSSANERCMALFPTALWVTLHTQPGDLRDDLVFEVTWHVAGKLADWGRFATAVVVWKAMLAAAEQDMGPDAPHTLAIREALGVSLQKAGDIPGAYSVFQDLMERRDRVGGSDLAVADARHQLGFLLSGSPLDASRA